MENWDWVVEIIHTAIWYGWLLEYCAWQMVVLLPKGNIKYRGIELVPFIWKMVPGITNPRIGAVVSFHNVLHGFRADRGMGTAPPEANMIHNMTYIREEVPYEFFFDLPKSYEALDRDHCR